MNRRFRLLAPICLLGTIGVLAFPGAGLSLDAEFIALTNTGPSPAAMTIPAGLYPVWVNNDSVAHTVTFANGCSLQIAPGGVGQCPDGFGRVVGHYTYTVDSTTQASVTVTPEWRDATVAASRHRFRLGARVLLHGTLSTATLSPPAHFGPRMPVTVLERPVRHRFWHRLAVVMAKPLATPSARPHSVWRLWVKPRGSTSYRVVLNSQPQAGTYWQRFHSTPFSVYARRHR